MSLEPGVLAKVDNRLRSELKASRSTITARVSLSKRQWAVWKRYCDMIGVSVGGGVAVLVDHELASVIGEEVETLIQSVKTREASVEIQQAELAEREEAVAKRERFCDFQERQLESQRRRLDEKQRQLESRQEALELLAAGSRPRSPIRVEPRPGRNQPCWCDSGKKYKNCHLEWDQEQRG